MANIGTKSLGMLLWENLKPSEFEGENPYLISLQENKYWIYIKKLSPAYFNNPDVWRAQLPIREIFKKCKSSPYPFILLGYDGENDVYTTWNPNFTKQRLNEAESVSFYSRYSLQQKVRETQEIFELILQNDNKVICFPRSKVLQVINSIDSYFMNDSKEYVALGSKRRIEANSAYRIFTNIQNIEPFFNYLKDVKGYSDKDAREYSQAIKQFIKKGIFVKYRTLFLKYNKIDDYHKTYDVFFTKEDVNKLNKYDKKIYTKAFKSYIYFLSEKININVENNLNRDMDSMSQTNNRDTDMESDFITKDGKLTKIKNPELLDLLRPILDTDYPSTNAALNIIYDFYKDKVGIEKMQLKDWVALIHNIEWENSSHEPHLIKKRKSSSLQGGKEYILSVTYPDGRIIKNSNSTTTFLQVIEDSFPDLILEMNIKVNGINLISKTKVKERQKQISSGYFVEVNTKTNQKAEILKKISDELDLGIIIELIPYGSNKNN